MRMTGRVAVALAVFGLAACGGGTSTVTVTQPVTVTVTETQAGAACSASRLRIVLPDEQLPSAVADTRHRMFDAAIACDYGALQAIALEGRPGFTFSYGAETSAADYWRGEEERGGRPLEILVRLLAQPFTRNEAELYAWPPAYTERPTEADWNELEGIYGRAQIDSWREMGTYLGYRVGISPAGEWQFFVAGD